MNKGSRICINHDDCCADMRGLMRTSGVTKLSSHLGLFLEVIMFCLMHQENLKNKKFLTDKARKGKIEVNQQIFPFFFSFCFFYIFGHQYSLNSDSLVVIPYFRVKREFFACVVLEMTRKSHECMFTFFLTYFI